MQVNEINLHNFRGARDLTLKFHPQMNLIVGINGSGKSTILEAIDYAFIALVRKVHNSKNNSSLMQVSDIHFDEDQAIINISASYCKKEYSWNIERMRPGSNGFSKESNKMLLTLSKEMKKTFKNKETLPIIVYYPVDRIVNKKIAPFFRTSNNMDHLDIYDNALEGAPNYQNFFRWFKDQEDIVNRKSMSRTHWIKRNSQQLSLRIIRLCEKLLYLINEKEATDSRLHSIHNIRNIRNILRHEPRFLFREIKLLIQDLNLENCKTSSIDSLLNELDDLLYKMDKFFFKENDSDTTSEDNLVETLERTLSIVAQIRTENIDNEKYVDVLWQLFILAFELGLWWLSDKGHSQLIKELSDIDWKPLSNTATNRLKLQQDVFSTMFNILKTDLHKQKTAISNYSRNLEFVSTAIEEFIPEYTNIRIDIDNNGSAQMLVDKNNKTFIIDQLSDGEKNLIAMIGDIARRLTIGNPDSSDPLKETGIILIDEIDLHLHPKWQRIVAERLVKVFPNCQFIVSSHSPQIISHVKPESIIALKNIEGEISAHVVNESYGKSSDQILEDIMDETSRPKEVENNIETIYDLIEEGDLTKAKTKIDEVRMEIGDDEELIRAEVLIKRQEILGK